MLSGLGTVLDKLQGLLGQSYVLAGVLPVLVLTCFSAVVLDHSYALVHLWLLGFREIPTANKWPYELLLILLLGVIGFVFWALNSYFRQILEGHRLVPNVLLRQLEADHQRQLDSFTSQIDDSRKEVAQFRQLLALTPTSRTYVQELLVNAVNTSQNGTIGEKVWSQARSNNNFLDRKRRFGRSIEFAAVNTHLKEVGDILLVSDPAKKKDCNILHQRLLQIVDYAAAKAETRLSQIESEREIRFPAGGISYAATRMGIVSDIPRWYSFNTFGFDVEAIWIHLQHSFSKDADFVTLLGGAKTQLDFAVGMVACFAFSLVVSALVAPWGTWNMLLFVVSTVSSAAGCKIFYEVSVQSYYGYVRVIQAAIDLYRLQVLAALQFYSPTDLAGERQLWQLFASAVVPGNKTNIPYRPV